MSKIYSDKQKELLRQWQNNGLRRINILEGSVRSGKTWISLVLWAFWVATMPKDGKYLMVAKTLTSLKRNCLDLLETLVGKNNFTYSISQKEGCLFGRSIYLEGVNDTRSESKIRGMTLQGAYCDELTLLTEDFFTMLLSRLSQSNAKLLGTTNPDTPKHWLMEKFINRKQELDVEVIKFLLEDNIFLDPEYVSNLKREYTGVFYDRFILGRWVVAEGRIYPDFDKNIHTTRELPQTGRYFISIDYGTVNPCSMGLWCVNDGKAVRMREYYHNSRKTQRQKTDEEYYQALDGLAGDLPIMRVVVDPSAASFIECIRRHKKYSVRAAKNEVIDGIRLTADYLQQGRLLLHESCKASIEEFSLYRWDDKADNDRPIKEYDHAMDDIRYFCNTILRRLVRGGADEDDRDEKD